jgi:hypothetical protein
MSFSHPNESPVSNTPNTSTVNASGSGGSHPSWWIQDFLHTTLGIARRKKGSPDSPDYNKEGGKSAQDPDPASTSGQIQLWQVKYKTNVNNWHFLKNKITLYIYNLGIVSTRITGRSAIKRCLDCVGG